MSNEMLGWERLATNLRVERALLDLLDVLEGLPVVVFKGPVLTRMIYGDLRQRASADNDVWVRAPFGEEALSRLLGLGYESSEHLDPERAFVRAGQVALWRRSDPFPISVDLHQRPFSDRYFRVSEETLLANLQTLELHGRELTTFNRPLAFTHMVAHFVQHLLEEEKLRPLGAAWDTWDLDPLSLYSLAAETCSVPALEASLGLAAHLGLCTKPVPEAQDPRARTVIRLLGNSRRGVHPLARKALALSLGKPEKILKSAWGAVFLEPDELHYRYGGRSGARIWLRHLSHLVRNAEKE